MRFKLIGTVVSLFLLPLAGRAQQHADAKEVASDSWKERGVMAGLNYSRYLFGEIGHYRNYVYRMGALPIFSTSLTYGCEVSYLNRMVVAPKVQARMHLYFFNASIAPVLYTDFRTTSLRLRPEAGLGGKGFDINYGYNVGITNTDFEQLNRHVVSLRYYFAVRQRGHHEYNSQGQRIN